MFTLTHFKASAMHDLNRPVGNGDFHKELHVHTACELVIQKEHYHKPETVILLDCHGKERM